MLNNRSCILIADDEARITRAIGDFLTVNDYSVLLATDGQEALDVFYEHSNQVDLILLDVMMPKRDGYSVLTELRDGKSLVPVVMLTAKGEEYDQLKGFKAGADDYITKPFSLSVLVAHIEAILKRYGKDRNNEIVRGIFSVNSGRHEVKMGDRVLNLTRREYELFNYFMINEGITLSREQLLDGVWGYDYFGEARTVDTHVKQLRGKLGDYAHCIATIHRVGYRFEVE